ncbi:unnamed protein product, partial [Allacma fusca]
ATAQAATESFNW